MSIFRSTFLALFIALQGVGCIAQPTPEKNFQPAPTPTRTPTRTSTKTPTNIILFIADGAGLSTHAMTDAWTGAAPVYRTDAWAALADATYCLRQARAPAPGADPLAQDPALIYDPAKAWDTTPIQGGFSGFPFYFKGYRWLRATAPDSAATISALMTGVPTYRGALNVDGMGNPTRTLAEAAHAVGKRVGVVTTVPFDHATPAGAAGVHIFSRNLYKQIAHQMLTANIVDVIGGAGNPFYDNNGNALAKPAYTYISPEDFQALVAQSQTSTHDTDQSAAADATAMPSWTLVESTSDIKALAVGTTPDKLIMIGKAGQTFQAYRKPRADRTTSHPGQDAPNPNMPSLTDLTLAALNALDDDPDGFFLMVEGGAVDWAMHDDDAARMIEEMIDFNNAAERVAQLLDSGERSFNWQNTLVIVTADHDHLILGPNSDTIPFEPITDNGPGHMPSYMWHNNAHSNIPVPFFVRGLGSEAFKNLPTRPDSFTSNGQRFERLPYFHETDVGRTLLDFVKRAPAPAQPANTP